MTRRIDSKLRDHLAHTAPIDFGIAARALGFDERETLQKLDRRSSFMKRWAALRYEYADAMLAASRKEGKS